MVIQLLILFILVEIVQTWFLLFEKRFFRGIKGVILTEILESALILYLILQGKPLIIFFVILMEVIQWLTIAIVFNFLK